MNHKKKQLITLIDQLFGQRIEQFEKSNHLTGKGINKREQNYQQLKIQGENKKDIFSYVIFSLYFIQKSLMIETSGELDKMNSM